MHVNIEKLWNEASKFEKQNVDIKSLKHMFKENVWAEKDFSLERFAYHLKRCKEASEDYPVIMVIENEEFFVLDGMHRIANAISDNKTNIEAIILPEEYNSWVVLSQ